MISNIPIGFDEDGNRTATGLRATVMELTGEDVDDVLGRNFEEELEESKLMKDGAFI